ncbi:MAG: hypothetical protein HQL52_09600 [Magnetococcales bacterium]|nr:hypothetical protein [Magnetococcales bacterium]
MDVALFTAKILGPLYLLVAVGMVLNPGEYRKMIQAFLDNPALTYLGAVSAAVAGLVLVNLHNVWGFNWTLIITLVGWLALFKGFLLLLHPGPVLRLSAAMMQKDQTLRMIAVGAGFFGLYLTAMGYR